MNFAGSLRHLEPYEVEIQKQPTWHIYIYIYIYTYVYMPPSRGSRITENYELDWFSQIYGNGMIRDWKVDPTSSDIRTTRQQLCRQQIWPRNGEFASLHMYIYIYINVVQFFHDNSRAVTGKISRNHKFYHVLPQNTTLPFEDHPKKNNWSQL